MILIDKALEKRNDKDNPIRVGMVGAGFMGRGIALQIVQSTPGMELVAIANRSLEKAVKSYKEAGVTETSAVSSYRELESCIANRRACITEDPFVLCEAGPIDVVLEVTGSIEFAAHVVLRAIQNGKHVVTMNAELDGTVGPILRRYADNAGVVYTVSDGDQPGVIMNLYRFVRGIGVRPILCGNIKGLHDPYRNPTTQKGFAKKWGQNPEMVTAFADGSKISFEQTVVANATEMQVARRGMLGPEVPAGTRIEEIAEWFPREMLDTESGFVDYVVGADPGPGVFVLGTHHHPLQRHYLNLYKLGEGPYYCFYRPYHLCHFEVSNSIARAAIFGDATIAPSGRPFVEVIAAAKTDLQEGEIVDGIGGYMTYGLCENSEVLSSERLIPMGLLQGCRLRNGVRKDQVLRYQDVEIPPDRLCDQLRQEQNQHLFGKRLSSKMSKVRETEVKGNDS